MIHKHDTGYKKLFSSPVLIKQLLTSFVDEPWITELDFDSLELLNKSFITDEFKKTESDVIYKVSFHNQHIYIYLLIEFQSTVDRFMSLRMLRYICEFYQYIQKSQKLNTLPAVFPLVLYNGNKKWTAPVNIKDLIEPSIGRKYIPDFHYYKIAENEFSKEVLVSIKNMVSALFYIENSIPAEIEKEIEVIMQLIKNEKPEEIKLLKNWIFYIFNNTHESLLHEELKDITEVKTMFAEALEKYGEQWKQEGKIEATIETKTQTAQKMLADGFDTQSISKYTGLSREEIQKLMHA